MATNEYLESLFNQAKEHLPKWLFNELHKVARAFAGGKARHKQKQPDETAINETEKTDAPKNETKQDGIEVENKSDVTAKPEESPEEIDAQKSKGEKFKKTITARLIKVDAEKKVALFIVSDPYQVDAHDDWISPNEVENYAHGWMEKSRDIRLRHKKKINDKVVVVESWMEPYPSTEDYRAAMKGLPHRIHNRKFATYEEVPPEISQKIIEQAKKEKEEEE